MFFFPSNFHCYFPLYYLPSEQMRGIESTCIFKAGGLNDRFGLSAGGIFEGSKLPANFYRHLT